MIKNTVNNNTNAIIFNLIFYIFELNYVFFIEGLTININIFKFSVANALVLLIIIGTIIPKNANTKQLDNPLFFFIFWPRLNFLLSLNIILQFDYNTMQSYCKKIKRKAHHARNVNVLFFYFVSFWLSHVQAVFPPFLLGQLPAAGQPIHFVPFFFSSIR